MLDIGLTSRAHEKRIRSYLADRRARSLPYSNLLAAGRHTKYLQHLPNILRAREPPQMAPVSHLLTNPSHMLYCKNFGIPFCAKAKSLGIGRKTEGSTFNFPGSARSRDSGTVGKGTSHDPSRHDGCRLDVRGQLAC